MTREEKAQIVVECANIASEYAEMERNSGHVIVPHYLEYHIVKTALFPSPVGPVGETTDDNLGRLLKRWREGTGQY
jgi:hypothetical protein